MRRPGSIIWPRVRIWKDILATMDCPGGRRESRAPRLKFIRHLVHSEFACIKNVRVRLFTHTMTRKETTDDVQRWFQDTLQTLWPVAAGSLSFRKSPCIRRNCALCQSGEGHSSYVLYGKNGTRRFSIYVPEELAPEVERAVTNGRAIQELVAEAGRRYTLALKESRNQAAKR